jgi:hypothetical protein
LSVILGQAVEEGCEPARHAIKANRCAETTKADVVHIGVERA